MSESGGFSLRALFLASAAPWEDKGRRLVSFEECADIFCTHARKPADLLRTDINGQLPRATFTLDRRLSAL